MNLEELAAQTVAVYRDEFPGEGPDWESDWWANAWGHDGFPRSFMAYLGACKRIWNERHD